MYHHDIYNVYNFNITYKKDITGIKFYIVKRVDDDGIYMLLYITYCKYII